MMRQHLLRRTTPSALFALALAFNWALPSTAFATPVYLRLDSLFPTGNHPRKWLEERTKHVQFQRWLRVKTNAPDGKGVIYGWLAEDHLLTPLNLALEAVTTEDVPARRETEMDSLTGQILAKESPVLILETIGSWVRVQPLPASEKRACWVPTESLKPLARAQTRNAYIFKKTPVFVLPGPHARRIGELRARRFIPVIKVQKDWVEIKYQGGSGFVRQEDAWTLEDLGEKGARPLIASAPLRSAPLPYADLVTTLPDQAALEVIEAKVQRWGQVRIPHLGDAWWPIAEDFDDEKDPSSAVTERLLTEDLFSRKIFDMASSPAIPSLKFASAQGVYKTTDGKEWVKIPLFKNENYPISIASQGSIFIGPYVSDDQGETFQTWIRWDKLVATLKARHVITPKQLQILEVRPEDATGRHLSLKLNIGLPEPVRATTDDQGLTWRAL